MKIIANAQSDCGVHRQINEDSWLVDAELGLYAVADGMGGHGAGDVASRTAIDALSRSFEKTPPSQHDPDLKHHVANAVVHANASVYQQNQQKQLAPGDGMGTTLVGLYCPPQSDRAVAFNVGDSRIYRYRNQVLEQLTEDHTLLREWQQGGQQGPAPPAHIILRAVGLFDSVSSDIDMVQLERGDQFLICSDGLSDMLSDEELARELLTHQQKSAKALSSQLIRRANHHGGIDNITVITMTIE